MPAAATRRLLKVDGTSSVILLAWAFVVLPRLIQTVTAPKYRTTVSQSLPYSAQAGLAEYATAVLLLVCCLLVVVLRLAELPTDRRLALLALLAPWVFLVIRGIYVNSPIRIATVLYPLVVLALWVLGPPLQRLALLGYLTGLTAAISLLIAVAMPERGIYSTVAGEIVAADKEILPWGLLVGIFTSGNNLGQFLILGLPAIGLVPRRGWRLVLGAVTAFALVMTASRSSLIGLAVGLVVAAVMGALPRAARAAAGLVALLATAAVLVYIPLATTDDAAFTNRGFIWKYSLEQWATDPWFGLGPNYYGAIGKYDNPLGGSAFHGHNQFVQTLVSGGLVYLAVMAVTTLALIGAAVRWAGRGRVYPTVFLVAFFISCTFEVSFGVVDRGFLLPVTVVPMAVILLSRELQTTRTMPATLAPTFRRAATSADSLVLDMSGSSATRTTASVSWASASASATRSNGGAFNSTIS